MNLDDLVAEHRHMLKDSLVEGLEEVRAEAERAFDPNATYKLGHAGTHTPKLALGDYLSANATAPPSVHRGLFAGYTNVLANDALGDCGEAMVIHGIEGMRHAAGTTVPSFVAQDAINLYEPVGGYIPGDPSTDQGTDNDVLVKYWENPGVTCAADNSIHTIAGSIAVDPTNDLECQIAVYEFASLFCAWNMPITAQGQSTWKVVGDGQTGDSAPGSWGGHDTVALAYSGSTLDINTWGLWTPVEKAFRAAYAIGFFAVVAQDMLGRTGVSPTGLDWTALVADLQKI
jgi:hypothetical protein